MKTGCPGRCDIGIQRPIGVQEFGVLSNATRAEIVLLGETAWICETCGSVYVTSDGEALLLNRLPLDRPKRSCPAAHLEEHALARLRHTSAERRHDHDMDG